MKEETKAAMKETTSKLRRKLAKEESGWLPAVGRRSHLCGKCSEKPLMVIRVREAHIMRPVSAPATARTSDASSSASRKNNMLIMAEDDGNVEWSGRFFGSGQTVTFAPPIDIFYP